MLIELFELERTEWSFRSS